MGGGKKRYLTKWFPANTPTSKFQTLSFFPPSFNSYTFQDINLSCMITSKTNPYPFLLYYPYIPPYLPCNSLNW